MEQIGYAWWHRSPLLRQFNLISRTGKFHGKCYALSAATAREVILRGIGKSELPKGWEIHDMGFDPWALAMAGYPKDPFK